MDCISALNFHGHVACFFDMACWPEDENGKMLKLLGFNSADFAIFLYLLRVFALVYNKMIILFDDLFSNVCFLTYFSPFLTKKNSPNML